MTLAERSTTGPPPVVHGAPCSVGLLLERLPTAEAKALGDILLDVRWAHSAIYEALAEEGHDVGRQMIGRHRRAQCRCAA